MRKKYFLKLKMILAASAKRMDNNNRRLVPIVEEPTISGKDFPSFVTPKAIATSKLDDITDVQQKVRMCFI